MPNPAALLALQDRGPPQLLTATVIRTQNGVCSTFTPTINLVSWSLNHLDDVKYQINVDSLGLLGGSTTGLATSAGQWENNTMVDDTIGTGTPQTSQYRVKVVRKSDSAVVHQLDTNTLNFNTNRDGCAA